MSKLSNMVLDSSHTAGVSTKELPECKDEAKIRMIFGAQVEGKGFIVGGIGNLPVGKVDFPGTVSWAFDEAELQASFGIQGVGLRAEIYGQGSGEGSIVFEGI